MLSYPVRLQPTEDGSVKLTFPDIPEAVLVCPTEDEAIDRAPAVLETILASYVVESRAIPSPSDICGAPEVSTDRFSVVGIG